MGGATGIGSKGATPAQIGSGFDLAQLQGAADTNALAMHNRYTQLGIGVPGQPQPGDTNLTYGGQSTPEMQDLSEIPSESGGIFGGLLAQLGGLENSQVNNPIFNGSALNTLAEQSGFQAGASGGGTGPTGFTRG